MSRLNGVSYYHFGSSSRGFYKALTQKKYDAMSFNNHLVDLKGLKETYTFRASHFIRDPRDLCVSGFGYHKKAQEPWLHVVRDVLWYQSLADLASVADIALPVPQVAVSYQTWLKGIDNHTGLLYEICWREHQGHFAAMEDWQYDDPDTLELKYEDLFGNEVAVFKSLLEHYTLSDKQIEQGVKLAHKFSFEQRKKRENKHIAKGSSGQWREVFHDEAVRLFDTLRPQLLEKVGYVR